MLPKRMVILINELYKSSNLIKLISLIPFLDLHLSISNDIVSTKIRGTRDDFDFEIVNFPFLDGKGPRTVLMKDCP